MSLSTKRENVSTIIEKMVLISKNWDARHAIMN